jgi:hypothetical protein
MFFEDDAGHDLRRHCRAGREDRRWNEGWIVQPWLRGREDFSFMSLSMALLFFRTVTSDSSGKQSASVLKSTSSALDLELPSPSSFEPTSFQHVIASDCRISTTVRPSPPPRSYLVQLSLHYYTAFTSFSAAVSLEPHSCIWASLTLAQERGD